MAAVRGVIAECWRVGYDGCRGGSMQDTKKNLQEFEKWLHADQGGENARGIRDRKEIKQIIERELVKGNQHEIIKGEMCFKTSTDGYIRLDTIGGDYNCIVIEFAENKKEAMNNRFEDGVMLYCSWSNCVAGWLTSILHRVEVVLMNNNHFDFKDLMAFGMFILALLTFVFTFIR